MKESDKWVDVEAPVNSMCMQCCSSKPSVLHMGTKKEYIKLKCTNQEALDYLKENPPQNNSICKWHKLMGRFPWAKEIKKDPNQATLDQSIVDYNQRLINDAAKGSAQMNKSVNEIRTLPVTVDANMTSAEKVELLEKALLDKSPKIRGGRYA
jgi:hypothetical protein